MGKDWGEDAALFHPHLDTEILRRVPSSSYSGFCSIMELSYDLHECGRTSKSAEYLIHEVSVDSIESFCQIDKGCTEGLLLLAAFFE